MTRRLAALMLAAKALASSFPLLVAYSESERIDWSWAFRIAMSVKLYSWIHGPPFTWRERFLGIARNDAAAASSNARSSNSAPARASACAAVACAKPRSTPMGRRRGTGTRARASCAVSSARPRRAREFSLAKLASGWN
jgi:hypothetical protein